jgi:hypothetical protein
MSARLSHRGSFQAVRLLRAAPNHHSCMRSSSIQRRNYDEPQAHHSCDDRRLTAANAALCPLCRGEAVANAPDFRHCGRSFRSSNSWGTSSRHANKRQRSQDHGRRSLDSSEPLNDGRGAGISWSLEWTTNISIAWQQRVACPQVSTLAGHVASILKR